MEQKLKDQRRAHPLSYTLDSAAATPPEPERFLRPGSGRESNLNYDVGTESNEQAVRQDFA
jgi:hypothetical protein